MAFFSVEYTLKHTSRLALLMLCSFAIAMQAQAYRMGENSGTVSTPASYSTGTTASNTKNIAGVTNLTATLSINSGTYQSSATGCGFLGFGPCTAPYEQLSSNDVLGARESGATNNATSSMFTPNFPINNTRTAGVGNMGAWRVAHSVGACNVASSNECTAGNNTLTITFSRPVLNPVIHLSELGGLVGTEGSPTSTVHTRLTLSKVNDGAASAATLSLLSSNSNLAVVGANKIQAANVAAGSTISCTAGATTTGCGSVKITGLIKSVTFASSIYINRISGANPTIDAADGYAINVTVDEDFGDAPATYDNDTTNGAASHVVGELYLGGGIGIDKTDVLNYSNAPITTNNGTVGDTDDNGVTFASINGLVVNGTTTADVTVSAHTQLAKVCGWIDFNVNGTFDTNERSTTCVDSPVGAAAPLTLNWTIPAGASVTAGTRQGRVRVSYDTTNVFSPTGRLDSGEVEDHLVTVNALTGGTPLSCGSNMYALLGNTTDGFKEIRRLSTTGTPSGTTYTVTNDPNGTPTNTNAALAVSSDGTKIFVPTDYETLWVYDVNGGGAGTGAVVSNNAFTTRSSSLRMLRATVTNNNIGYFGATNQLYRFSTTSPFTVSAPVTMTVINPASFGSLSPAPSVSGSGDFFADSNGSLFLSVNPANQTFIDTFRIAANGNTIFLGRITQGVTSDTYGGYAALPTGVYASSSAGRIVSVDFDDFIASETATASTAAGNSDLASCYYPLLTPNVVVQKTATKVAGSSGTIVRSGDTLEYNIIVRNSGTLATAGATFQDSIPAGTTYVAGSTFYNYNTSTKAATALADDAGGVMPFVTERHIESPGQGDGTLLVDKTTGSTTADRDKEVLITFRVTVNAGAISVQNQGIAKYIDDPGPPTYTTIVSDDPGTPATNDSTNISVENADLVITKDDTVTSVVAGGATTYTITVTNNGPFDVANPVIADPQVVGIVQKTVTCAVPTSGTAVCPTVANLTLANFKAGIAIPSIPVGQSVVFTLSADISATSGTVSNVATITSTITDPDTSNNTATDSNTVTAPTAITADTPQKEARFTAVPDLPTIYRGAGGSQIITITNNGPDSATNAIATFKPVTQTGVSVTAVSVVGGGVCTFAAGEWTCPTIPTVANAGTFQLNVTYATTSAAALGQAPQAEIRVKSDEFNPGSGVNETLYKVWGSNQTNEIRPNGAFWVGYEGTGGTTAVGTAYDEANPILTAWPATQASPTGAYLVTANPNRRTSVYAASSTSAAPTISRIVTNMSTDVDKSVVLPLLSSEYAGDNRRAWEYRTGIYVPTAQSLSLCIANTSVGIDDGAYIMVDGVVQATQDTYVGGGIVSASLSLAAGYHALVYRITNQNTAANSAEVGAGGYGSIGVSTSGTCNTSGFDQWGNTAVPASVNIIDAADLSVTKTNSVSAVNAGGTTSYSIVVSNAGPSLANNAVFQDTAATGLTKTSVSCVAAGGAVCPTTPTVAQIEAGLAIATLPSGGSVTFTVGANVTATSGSVANIATVTAPAGTTEINSANNSATDTDTVTPRADLSISKTDSVASVNAAGTTSYSIVISNAGPSAANAAVFQDAAATGLTKTSVSCVAAGGAVCPTTPTVAQIEAGLAIATLPSGGSVTFTVGANVTATSGSVANIATVTAPAGTTEINSANNSATDTDTVTPNADLSITKTNSVSAVNAGGTTSYSIVISNAGPSAANTAVFQDAAATGLTKTSVSCVAAGGAVCPTAPTVAQIEAGLAIATLPSGGSVTFTVGANVTATSGSVANIATVTAPAGTTEINSANNSATDTDTVTPNADLSITKTNSVSAVNAGGTTSYSIVVSNAGPSLANNAVFQDAAATGLTKTSVSCVAAGGAVCPTAPTVAQIEAGLAIATLPSGGSVTFTVGANVTATSGSVTNVATITAPAGTTEINSANNSTTDTDGVLSADLVITKSGPSTAKAGDYLTYTLKVWNKGPTAVTDAVVTDIVPSQLSGVYMRCTATGSATCGSFAASTSGSNTRSATALNLPADATGNTHYVTYQITALAYSTGAFTNTATVSSATMPELNNADNSASQATTITVDAPITTGNAADQCLAADARNILTPTSFTPYSANHATQTLTAVIDNVNTAKGTGTNGALVLTGKASWSYGIPRITAATITLNVNGTAYAVLTTVGASSNPNLATWTALNGATISPATVTLGTYNQVNTAVDFTLTLPTTVTTVNTATAVFQNISPTGSTSVAGDDMGVQLDGVLQCLPKTDLSISKTNSVSVLNAGGSTSYSVVVTNAGPSAANTALFQDTAVAGLNKTSVSCTAASGAVCPSTPTVAQIEAGLAIPTLPSGGSVTFTIGATVTAASGSVSNTATVAVPSGTLDTNSANNSATDTDTVTPQTDLSITKTDGVTSVNAGASTSYSIVVSNAGPSAANAAIFQDAAATGLTKTSVSCAAVGGAVCPTSPTVTQIEAGLAIPTLPSGGSVTFTVGANVTASSGTFANTATITAPSGTTEINTANNSATDTDSVIETSVSIAGRVFTDNSGTTGNASNAYNSVQDAGEVGLAAVTVQLTNCSNTILATTKTDALGDYTFNVLQNSLSAPNFCVVEQNGVGYTSVSGTSGYSRSTDSITLAKTAATSYSGHNFGDARLGLMLTSDGQQTTTPAGTVSYAHTLTTDAVLTPTFATSTSQQPNNVADQGWTTLLYLDSNCNGQVDGSEAPVGTLSPLLPNQSVCVVQRVNAPASASNGAQHVASLSASYVATVQGGATLTGSSQTRTDTTLVGTAGLDMTKQVRVVSSCPSNDSSSTGFVARNTAKNGDFLEYEIIYKNRSTRNLSTVVVRDAVPSHALFKSALCMSTPSGAACAVSSTPAVNATGTLSWNITGPVAPNAQGSVRFCVQVPALAEGPQ